MKKALLSLAILACTTLGFAQTEAYLEGFTSNVYRAKGLEPTTSLNSGREYAQLTSDGKAIVRYDYQNGKALDTIVNLNSIRNCPIKTIIGFEFDSQEQRILIHTDIKKIYRRTFTTNYYVYTIRSRELEPLSEIGDQQMAAFSPNGRMIAFARNNNLYLKKLDFKTETAITTDGEFGKIINGTPDWVYEEEFGSVKLFEWSSDSKLIAYARFDENNVREFSFQFYNDSYPTSYNYKYPKAGTQNSKISLMVFDVTNRTTKEMDIATTGELYIPIFRFTNEPDQLAVVRLNRIQTELDLLLVNARSGIAKRILSETDNSYIDYQNYEQLSFNPDNSFVAMSERDGYRHLYLYNSNGTIQRQLTKGKWEVTSFYGYDPSTKTAYYQSAQVSPLKRDIYKVDAKGRVTCLSKQDGTYSATFSKQFVYYIEQFSNTTTPSVYTLKTNTGTTVRKLEDNAVLKATIDGMHLPKKEFITVTTPENMVLNGWMVKPQNMDPHIKYPLVMVQYSGPNSQEVRDNWDMNWEYYLAEKGFIVACVDGRGTGARGREFRNCTYKFLGQLETQDQISAARYFGSLPYIDSTRMAIWGWSYGGFMTLMSMTHGNGTFKAGVAVAPVTDWRMYNTAYTERFMSRPQENFQGYDATSLLDKADQLQGDLLIIHGTADDNVHVQQTMVYIDKLVDAGKQFEMQLYTNKNHSILGNKTRLHLYKRMTDFLEKHL